MKMKSAKELLNDARKLASIIFSDEELTQIEDILGTDFIVLYGKLWDERNSVKTYRETVKKYIASESGYHKMYWEYKLGEIEAVIENQSRWLRKVAEQLEGKISDEMYSKLMDYLDKNEDE